MTRGADPRTGPCAEAVTHAFLSYHIAFKEISRGARGRFETCDWRGLQRDAEVRLGLYSRAVARVVRTLAAEPAVAAGDRRLWAAVKEEYARRVAGRADRELALTFFNSVTRRLYGIAGVDPSVEFFGEDFPASIPRGAAPPYETYEAEGSTRRLLERVLADYRFRAGYEDATRDARLVADRVDAHLAALPGSPRLDRLEAMKPVFYRNKGAYIVARLRCGGEVVPLVVPLVHLGDRIAVDAALLDHDDVSIVFSFTRSYFHVEAERPAEVVEFLKSIMPHKPIAEIYTAIGFNRHGKTELYRSLVRFLEASSDRFEYAPGSRGMVMEVITLPSFDVVFKIIKDRFEYPKTATRREVIERYNLVFKHDRVGRLVDTQEFEHLTFDRRLFPDDLLAEITRSASRTVSADADSVTIGHLYTERRLTPLDLYLRQADETAAAEAVVDYGNAIKDLAAANIFPGDSLLKNFGVTRHGRVAFYDYDEVCLLTDCAFRDMPAARNLEDEFASEPWFGVGEHDIFPEEFRSFLGLSPRLRDVFEEAHGDLFGVAFWAEMQERLCEGEIADIFPYRQSVRFAREAALGV